MTETRADADNAFDFFIRAYGAKHDKAVTLFNSPATRPSCNRIRVEAGPADVRLHHSRHSLA